MKIVMGELNGVRLLDLMNASTGHCNRVTAAVAYATNNNPLFQHCRDSKLFLDFYGLLDEDEAVATSVLESFLQDGPLAVNCRLIKGHFHSKIIWWHGWGAYIGSANLTHKAWFSNVETGIFYEEAELEGSEIGLYLEQQFEYLKKHSAPLTSELVKALRKLNPAREVVQREKNKFENAFAEATKDIPFHHGLDTGGPSLGRTKYTDFSMEWSETLEKLRGLRNEFVSFGLRPKWVPLNANPTVHFDQFLHAYYYVRVRDDRDDDESAKSIDLVNKSYLKNRSDPAGALRDAAEWWASLPAAPYNEDKFIETTSGRLNEQFSKERLSEWTVKDFQEAFWDVHAFRSHARQVKNSEFGLPEGHKETVEARSDRLAEWLWSQPRKEGQKTVKELLQFLIWGSTPDNMAERLWLATTSPEWKFDHLGRSSLGEAVGWARPDDFPPRNNRTNKALRSLGHEILLFSA